MLTEERVKEIEEQQVMPVYAPAQGEYYIAGVRKQDDSELASVKVGELHELIAAWRELQAIKNPTHWWPGDQPFKTPPENKEAT